MSYDLQIYQTPHGKDPFETIQEIFEQEESEENLSFKVPDLFAQVLSKVHHKFEWSNEFDPEGELLKDEYGLLISASSNYIEISMAYWHSGKEAEQAMTFLTEVVEEIIQHDSTLWCYDPQEDRVFKSLSAEPAVEHMERGNQILHQVVDSTKPKKPWWKFW